MSLSTILLIYGALFLGVLFATQGLAALVWANMSPSSRRVGRRLDDSFGAPDLTGSLPSALRAVTDTGGWRNAGPLRWLSALMKQAGMGAAVERLLFAMACLALLAYFALLFFIPFLPFAASVSVAMVIGVSVVILYVTTKRTQRLRKFGEQLVDAVDLLVRNLRVGQSLTAAVKTVAQESPEPMGDEFKIAHEQASHGKPLAGAFEELADRVPVEDLRYLALAIRINHESGGNLAEALNGMSQIIRDRLRIFRKIHALTAEGRFSAWFLSLFPVALYFMIQLVKPDYYTQVMDWPYFFGAVATVIVLLIINVIAMRIITSIKV